MRIILLQDIKGLGKKYEAKEAADGYVRNFLLPNKLAEIATPSALKKLEILKANMEKEEAEDIRRLNEIARLLKDRTLEFTLKSDEKGSVFGSITKEMILKALRDANLVRRERVEINLEHPIKKLGEYEIEADLKKGIKAKLKISVKAEE